MVSQYYSEEVTSHKREILEEGNEENEDLALLSSFRFKKTLLMFAHTAWKSGSEQIDRKFVSLFHVEHLIDLNWEIFSSVKWYFSALHSQDGTETTGCTH